MHILGTLVVEFSSFLLMHKTNESVKFANATEHAHGAHALIQINVVFVAFFGGLCVRSSLVEPHNVIGVRLQSPVLSLVLIGFVSLNSFLDSDFRLRRTFFFADKLHDVESDKG